jgi:signal transduction histidine kinase
MAPRPAASQAETADLVPAAEAAPLTPVRRGLFAPPPAAYIEGDFIAAQRVGDRWIVVKPRPEAFPTAWQSRVMLWFLLSFILVGPLGWLFASRLTAPLRSFADAAERLGRDPSAPATVEGGSAEIARAAAAFNLMQARLKRYVEDRTAMIGAISHDLRTPLTRMRFRLEAAPEKLKPGFESDMDQMEAMISSVLTFMRDQAEGGARERLDLRTLLDEAVKNAVAGGADVALEPGEPVEVQADPVALNRVFANLLDNAVKYGGRAVVRLDKDGAEAIATVRDFGPGLPESELERVFKPFYRAPHAVASDASGMGLGLANSRSIVLAHGGAIRLRSQDGLTAEVRLPAAA